MTLASRRFRASPRAAWFGARATNVLRRRGRLAGAAALSFLIVLLGYLLLPAGAQGIVTLFGTETVERRDTTALRLRENAARGALDQAEVALDAARAARASALAFSGNRALTPDEQRRRDSLGTDAAALAALLARSERAPLAESFRALGDASALRGDRRVRALVDSLAEVERERDELGGGATVDPVYVALTTQANTLGRAIQSLGELRLAALRRELEALDTPSAATIDSTAPDLPDTLAAVAARQQARTRYDAARQAFATGVAANAAADSAAAAQRASARLAPIPVLIVAALIIATALSFALALLDEMRSPRVADAVEAERTTLLRVLASPRERVIPAERSRRDADRSLPRLVDPTYDAYRILAWHLTSQWPRDGIVTVTGDNPVVAATVAANLAAVLANDARITLLVDADFVATPVRRVFSLPQSAGLAAVLANRRKWSESLLSLPVGRGRSIDVLPSGNRTTPLGPAESQALVGEVRRAARRYDATVVVASLDGARRARAGDDVIVCATRTETPVSALQRTVLTLIDGGARVRGVVLWSGKVPEVESEGSGTPDHPGAATPERAA